MRFLHVITLASLWGCATAEQVQVLQQRVDLLEMQVEEISHQPRVVVNGTVEGTVATTGGAASCSGLDVPAGTGGDEQQAKELFRQIQAKVNEGDALAARSLMLELKTEHGGTSVYASNAVKKKEKEVGIVSKSVSNSSLNKHIDNWFVSGDLALDQGTTILVFWEEWCPHCRREMPELAEVYDDYKDDGLKMVGLTKVSKSSTESKVMDFIVDNSLNFPMAKENGKISPIFCVTGVPAAAVVRDGTIIWRGHPSSISPASLSQWL